MDIDMDIDELDVVVDEPYLQVEEHQPDPDKEDGPDVYREDITNPLLPCLDKVHLRGLDELNTKDIKAFAAEHYPSQELSRVEWIDDTSANLVYPTEETATEALLSFSLSLDDGPLSELRAAKTLSSHPHYPLQVRQANSHDVKKPNAREQSRFYLFNPEYDRQERRRLYDNRRGRERGGRRYKRRRSEPDNVPFDVNLYDDDEESLAKRADNSRISKRARYESDHGNDLFANRMHEDQASRIRHRSASPRQTSYEDGRHGFRELDSPFGTSPPFGNRKRSNANVGRELMSSPAANARTVLREISPAPREINSRRGSERDLNPNAGKELFPNSTSGGVIHRRTEAFDAADEAQMDLEVSPQSKPKSRALADRITGGPPVRGDSSESRSTNLGFQIKGAASKGDMNPRVKELFPEKFGASNSGKELFPEELARRQKAEDHFYK